MGSPPDLVSLIESTDARVCDASLGQRERRDAQTQLFALWRTHDDYQSDWNPTAFERLGASFRRNDPLLAYEVFTAGLVHYPSNRRLRYQQALTLARIGHGARALEIAEQLMAEPDQNGDSTDVVSLVARVLKDRGLRATKEEERREILERARAGYQNARISAPLGRKSYPTINEATLALVLGDRESAMVVAADARAHAEEELRSAESERHWQLATIAEACFILGDMENAERHYREAVLLAGRRFDDIGSMRRNGRLIAEQFGDTGSWIETVLRIPSVVVFSGHMIDRQGRNRPRFPTDLENLISNAIDTELEKLNAGFGFAGAACGGDILFLEAMMKRGHIHVVLPFAAEEFVKTSVDVTANGSWVSRFRQVLDSAEIVQEASGAPSDWGGIVFEYANLLLLGLAIIRSKALDTELVGLAVWDGAPGDGPGGTAETVASWRQRGMRVVVISPQDYMTGNSID